MYSKKCADGIEDFQYKRCKNETKTELNNVYKTIKIHSIINKEVKGLVCVEKLKITKKMIKMFRRTPKGKKLKIQLLFCFFW